MALFNSGWFELHSGDMSPFKIDCDVLTKEDWSAIAEMLSYSITFKSARGIPRGGLAFAEALQPFCTPDGAYELLVDDIFTTGSSFEEHRKPHETCVVLFARGFTPPYVLPMFQAMKIVGLWHEKVKH